MTNRDEPVDAVVLAWFVEHEKKMSIPDAIVRTAEQLRISEERVREVVRADTIGFGG